MLDKSQIEEAARRIRPYIRQTLLDQSIAYSQTVGANVHFKCENLQHTGSFKVRGALNKVLSLEKKSLERGIVTASTGNHGAATAFAMQQVGGQAMVFVPETAVDTKLQSIEQRGATIKKIGTDGLEAELAARAYAEQQDLVFVSPYNDTAVMAGQGSIGVELLRQLPELDAVFVSVGGGGLIGGIATYLKAAKPDVQIIGCSPENSNVMAESVRAGRLLDLPSLPTLSDGTAGGVEPDSVTFEPCRTLVDQYVDVSEEEIAASLRDFMNHQHMLIEGSAAVAIAGLLKMQPELAGMNVAVVLCGANISLSTLKAVL